MENHMRKASLAKRINKSRSLYVMILPCMIFTFIFSYYPLTGWIMAFENFKPAKGYWGSKFVGLDQFRFLFDDFEFWRAFRNTVAMSLLNLVFGFLFAIVFALLLNEIRHTGFKRITQTVSYLPHFLSWVIVCALVQSMLASDGIVNNVIRALGITDKPILFLGEPGYFWWVVVFANVWKEMGWNSIIYIAAISGIDPALYEAAELDGAGRFRRMWHVTLPGIRSTIVVLLIMNLGSILNAGFEVQYLLGSNGLLVDVSQTIDIFVLKYGMSIGNYSLATAAGMFKTVISVTLVFGANAIANRFGETSLM
ncbi:MAG: sugar ABC transporter permease [Clostridia bacterium]|nr:sugar ABC transporter permease [Clostridia bacterium]